MAQIYIQWEEKMIKDIFHGRLYPEANRKTWNDLRE